MQANCFPIIYSHVTHVACWTMLLVMIIPACVASPLNSSTILESIVQQATDNSSDGHNTTSSSLTDRLLSIMRNRGVELRRKCKPQSIENLRLKFLEANELNECVTLTRVNVLQNEDVFAVTSKSNCITNQRMDPACFPDREEAQCSTGINVTDLSCLDHDYFPKLAIGVACGGCRNGDRMSTQECQRAKCGYTEHLRPYNLLKRVPNMCDENGKDVWIVDTGRRVNVACSCLLKLALG